MSTISFVQFTRTVCLAVSASLLAVNLTKAQTPPPANASATQNADFATRYFARKASSMQVRPPAEPATFVATPGKFIVDAQTRNSNELIVRLNHDNSDRVAFLAPGLAKNAAAPAVERAFQRAVLARDKALDLALGGPIHVRYMIAIDRMSDEDRAAAAVVSPEAKATGLTYDPRERLDRYMVLRYDSVALAQLALARLRQDTGFAFVGNNSAGAVKSSTPNDAYFSNNGNPAQYQWGLHQMQFPAAWDKTRGQSYVGVLDAGWPGLATTLTPYPWSGINLKISINVHDDLKSNFRNQMIMPEVTGIGYAPGYGTDDPTKNNGVGYPHTVHVSGILAAQHNNGTGTTPNSGYVAGACPECSFVTYPYGVGDYGATVESIAKYMRAAVDSGMQLINWSGGNTFWDCVNAESICTALSFATQRSVLVVQSAGNNNNTASGDFPATLVGGPHFPANLGDGYSIFPVGGVASNGQRWTNGIGVSGKEQGSNWASIGGVMGPAKSIVSTFPAGLGYGDEALSHCGDAAGYDESYLRFPGSGLGDGVGSCTGTSMAAPYITALAGLITSIKPRATANEVRNIIRQSGSNAASPSAEYGYGLPNALTAVNAALAVNPTRLTPLFSYYSYWRSDSLYTTVPHMARSAALGMMRPRVRINDATDYLESKYVASYGTGVTGYSLPGASGASWGGDTSTYVKAQVWVFTTDLNPKNAAVPLRAMYRMSWKCNDPSNVGQPYACTAKPRHMDTVLVDKDELAYFAWLGYQVDGIEGFVYPKNQPQPLGTVRLMRKYNADLDDHAIFPESAYSSMYSQGWMYDTNYNDWLGYVYPNTGSMPTVQ